MTLFNYALATLREETLQVAQRRRGSRSAESLIVWQA